MTPRLAAATLALLVLTGCASTGKPAAKATISAVPSSSPSASASSTAAPTATISTSPAATAPSTPTVGSWLLIEPDGEGTGRVNVSALRAAAASQFYQPKGRLMAATVTIESIDGTITVNPLYFSARTAAGDSLDFALGGTEDQLDAAEVTEGQKLRGTIAFDVPAGQKIAVIIMADPLGQQLATWDVR